MSEQGNPATQPEGSNKLWETLSRASILSIGPTRLAGGGVPGGVGISSPNVARLNVRVE